MQATWFVVANVLLLLPARANPPYKAISAGAAHTVALGADGSAWAVGSNEFGQLGDGSNTDRHSLVQVLSDVRSVSAGKAHTIFVKRDGSAWATGSNSHGQLGVPSGTKNAHRPVLVMTGVSSASAGERHSILVMVDGAAYSMGDNSLGQLGDGTQQARHRPVKVMMQPVTVTANWVKGTLKYERHERTGPLKGIKEAAAGSDHSLFVMADGRAMATGANHNGELGTGVDLRGLYCDKEFDNGQIYKDTSFDCPSRKHFRELRPVQVNMLGAAVGKVAAGGNYSLLSDPGGFVWATGKNDLGQTGGDFWGSMTTPFRLILPAMKSFSAGGRHSVLCGQDGNAYVTGFNKDEQLGFESALDFQVPAVAVLSGVQDASAGDAHTVFLNMDGGVWAAGSNAHGQIGSWTMPLTLVAQTTTAPAPEAPPGTTSLMPLDSTVGVLVMSPIICICGVFFAGATWVVASRNARQSDEESGDDEYEEQE